MYSLIIKNARLIDGSGKPERLADIAIEGDKIVAVADKIDKGARTVIDAAGKIVCPGFIDIQNHSDSYWQLFDNPSLDSLVTQGYTTILVGACGASVAPLLSRDGLLALQKWHTLDGVNFNWASFAEFRDTMSARKFGCNVGSLVGYSTLRRGLVNNSTEALTKDQLATLRQALTDALSQGAFGMSSGLAYAHELTTTDVELFELAQIIKQTDTLLSIHLRNEADQIVESVREVIDLAQQSEVNVKISHLKIRNRANWGKTEEVITELENAWHRGARIHFDIYPYAYMLQALYSYLPKWAIAGGRVQLLEQMRNPTQRTKILSALTNSEAVLKDMVIASTASRLQVNGKKIGDVAASMEVSSEEAVLNLIENGGSEVQVFDQCLDESSVAELSHHALAMIGTDGGGFPVDTNGKLVHPRAFGAAPRFLRQVIDGKKISLPEAIRKLTSAPAGVMGLKDRGTITAGNFADLVIFDESKISDRATLNNPFQFSVGIEHVLVNGEMAMHSGQLIAADGGRFLTKN